MPETKQKRNTQHRRKETPAQEHTGNGDWQVEDLRNIELLASEAWNKETHVSGENVTSYGLAGDYAIPSFTMHEYLADGKLPPEEDVKDIHWIALVDSAQEGEWAFSFWQTFDAALHKPLTDAALTFWNGCLTGNTQEIFNRQEFYYTVTRSPGKSDKVHDKIRVFFMQMIQQNLKSKKVRLVAMVKLEVIIEADPNGGIRRPPEDGYSLKDSIGADSGDFI